MKRKINLYWHKHSEGHGNFGDELNHYIVKKLSNSEINYINIELLDDRKVQALKLIIYNLFYGKLSLVEAFKYFKYNFFKNPTVIVCIGSVLQYCKMHTIIVWGAGIINNSTELRKCKIVAVRGFYTVQRLKELGYDTPKVVGDPAVLLPLVYPKTSKKKYFLGVIPHHIHYDDIVKKELNENIIVINLLDPIELIISQINMCEQTISTSLHGLIVSHSYGIPSLWVSLENSKRKLVGDNVKFNDYFSSVEIQKYESIFIEYEVLQNEEMMSQLFENYKKVDLPHPEIIQKLQKQLLITAPFEILNHFKQ